jgi:TetR/AcrR family transcriptional regulator
MGIKERKARERTRRRNAILKAAKRLIGRTGVEGMSMNQLADLTELNKATLYSYFSNKDDIIDAIVYEGLLQLDEELGKGESDSASGLGRMLHLIRTTFDFYREHPVHFLAMNHQEHRGPGARTTPSSTKGDEVAARIFGRIRKTIEQGMKDGSIRGEIDIDSFLIVYFAYTHGVMHTVFAKQDVYVDVLGLIPENVERAALEFIKHFLERKGKP